MKVVHFDTGRLFRNEPNQLRWTGCGRLTSQVADSIQVAGLDLVSCKSCLASHAYNDACIEAAEKEGYIKSLEGGSQ